MYSIAGTLFIHETSSKSTSVSPRNPFCFINISVSRSVESRFVTLPVEYRYRHGRPALYINRILAASPIESINCTVSRASTRPWCIYVTQPCVYLCIINERRLSAYSPRAIEEAHVRNTCARIKPTARDSIERDVDVTRYERTGISGKVTPSVPSEAVA